MKQRIHYLKNITVLGSADPGAKEDAAGATIADAGGTEAVMEAPATEDIPCTAENGTLYVATPGANLKTLADSSIPFVVYVDTLTYSGSTFFDGAKYVLEGEGEFDPHDFDPEELEKIYKRLKKIPWDILETDRCVIKETSTDDLDEFYSIYAEPGITRFTEDLMERSEEEKYTENYRDLIYEIYGHGIWTIIKKDTNEIIGRAGLDERAGFDTPELGFVIGKPWQKQGYAYEVCSAILSWAAENDISEIMSLTEKENAEAVKLLKKLGFSEQSPVSIGTSEYVRFIYAVK